MRKDTSIDRILLVLDPGGALRAAHQERLERYIDGDGQVIMERYLPAEPVDTAALAGVIGDEAAKWSAQALALSERAASLEASLASEVERGADLARRLELALAASDRAAQTPPSDQA
jgi:hypothetical protein